MQKSEAQRERPQATNDSETSEILPQPICCAWSCANVLL